MIADFKTKAAAAVYAGKTRVKGIPPDIIKRAANKLVMLDAARNLEDLRFPPSNHLEALRGDRQGQYSIRINQQWRICFTFENGEARGVEIADYH